MSVGTSDTTVISSTKTEARNLNAIDAPAAQRDGSSSTKRHICIHTYYKAANYLFILLTVDVCGIFTPIRSHFPIPPKTISIIAKVVVIPGSANEVVSPVA